MSDKVKAFLGIAEDFKGLFNIYPPKIYDTLDTPNFNKFFSLFTISQEDIEDQIFSADEQVTINEGDIPTPYQYITNVCKIDPQYADLIKEGFQFFTHEELTFIPEKDLFLLGNLEDILMNLKDLKELPILKEEDYFDFQNAIRAAMGQDKMEPYNYNKHPKKRKMDAKARLRDRVKAKQSAKTGKGATLENNLASICCMGIGLTPLNIGEMSYAAMSVIMSKYQLKERYDLDMKILTSGFGSNKKIKPKYWMQENDEK